MAGGGQTLQLAEGLDQGRRIELARVAARRSQAEMAAVAEISVRSYRRTIAGERPARRGELAAWAQLTGQDVEFFSSASPDANEDAILPPPLPAIKAEVA